MKKYLVTFILLRSLTVSGVGQEVKQAPQHDQVSAATSAEHGYESTHGGVPTFKPEFENESVQVFRITIRPHEKIPMHELTPRVVVLLTDEHLKLTFPSGETREESHWAGETMWLDSQRHAGENLSDKPIQFIVVIPKRK